MKFICNKEELIKGLNIVIRAAYSKYQKSILECIHIAASDHTILLDTFDMVTAIKTSVYADIQTPGQTALPARILFDIVNKLPNGEICFEKEGSSVNITGENSKTSLTEMDPEQFPAFPNVEGNKFSINRLLLKRMIEKTAFSAYTGDDRPIFTGLFLETDPDSKSISIVGIDGIRMAKNNAQLANVEKVQAIIPAKTLKEASRIMGEEDSDIDLYFSASTCFLLFGETVMFTRLLDGEYMNYQAIIPAEYKTRVKVETKLFERSLEFMMVLAREDGSNLIRMSIESEKIELYSVSEYGAARDQVPVETEGELLKIAFNAKYLLDIFKIVEDEQVYMEFTGRLQACVVRPAEGNEFLYLVVPVNVAE